MAKKNRNDKVWMIPEGEQRANASYHFVHPKTMNQIGIGENLLRKKNNQGKGRQVGLINSRIPPTGNR